MQNALETISKVYSIIVTAGIHKAQSIKVAEAAKIIENTQRDVNIALMNELSIIFNKMGINTYDVLDAAGTKWNFIKMMPGLVGGHCIGVDPYYLTYKAQSLGYHAQVINSGRYVNDSMGFYIAKQVAKKIIAADKDVSKAKVLVLGVTFKENVSDIRNSKVADLVKELASYGLAVDVVDPYADAKEIEHEYGFEMSPKPDKNYDAVIVAVCHKEFMEYDEKYFQSLCNEDSLFVDVKGVFRNKIKNMTYWSL
jgi:UDP-N-acetyl-D-galactosamine dehydrogenase